jgi:hypothetical protein
MKIGKPVSTAINVSFVVVLATAVFQRFAHDGFWPAMALALICIGMIVVARALQGRVMGANVERVQSGTNSGMQRSADHQDILDASPAYIRAAAIVSVALSAIGLSVSTYVYLRFPHPGQVIHLVRSGELVEPIEQYLFLFVVFQVVVMLAVCVDALRWRHMFQRLADQERTAKARYPRLRALDATFLYKMKSVLACLTQVILLGATLWRALMVVTNNV